MHRPIYCSWENERCNGETHKLREFFEDLFVGSIDLVVAGHLHNYERTYPMFYVLRGLMKLHTMQIYFEENLELETLIKKSSHKIFRFYPFPSL